MSFLDNLRNNSPQANRAKLKAEQAAQVRKQVDETIIQLKTRRDMMSNDIQRSILNIRKCIKNPASAPGEKRRLCNRLRLQLGQYWYMGTMLDNVETLDDQMKLMDMTVDFGNAMQEVNSVVKDLNKDIQKIDFVNLTKRFVKATKPMSMNLGQYFQEMNETLVKSCSQNVFADQFDDQLIENIVNGGAWEYPPETLEPPTIVKQKMAQAVTASDAPSAPSSPAAPSVPSAPSAPTNAGSGSEQDRILAALQEMAEQLRG